MRSILLAGVFLFFAAVSICTLRSQKLRLPPRSPNALKGSELIEELENLSRRNREERIFSEIISGNIPDFLRQFVAVDDTLIIGKKVYHLRFYCSSDYMALGDKEDYLLVPMSASLAQRIVNYVDCILPTSKMVDIIYEKAAYKLRPQPILPSPEMTTIPVFAQHRQMIRQQMDSLEILFANELMAGHKKDVILSNKIYYNLKARVPKPVVIYGWHRLNGAPIQPTYNGHGATYADYSHGIRLVYKHIWINDRKKKVSKILRSKKKHVLLSAEGRIMKDYYPIE